MINFKKILLVGATTLAIASNGKIFAAECSLNFGVVDFTKCVMQSKYGKFETDNFESLKNQMGKAVGDIESQLQDAVNQLQNQDILDSLSPEAEQSLKEKCQALSGELNRYQSQYYQFMQQSNMKLMQNLAEEISKASETIAHKKKLSLVINKEAVFYTIPSLDITDSTIVEMDKKFDKEKQTKDAASSPKLTEPANSNDSKK